MSHYYHKPFQGTNYLILYIIGRYNQTENNTTTNFRVMFIYIYMYLSTLSMVIFTEKGAGASFKINFFFIYMTDKKDVPTF